MADERNSEEQALAEINSWNELVARGRELVRQGKRQLITLYWQIGELVQFLHERGEVIYGQHTVSDFAESVGIDESSARYAEKFRATFTEEQYNRIIESDDPIAWRGIQALCNASDDVRERLIEPYLSGEINSDQLRDMLRQQAIAGAPAPPQATSRLKAATKVLTGVELKLEDLSEDMPDIVQDPDSYGDDYVEFLNKAAAVTNLLDSLRALAE